MRFPSLRFALWAALACAAGRAHAETPLPADVSREELMIPMRDGVLLATDLYRPAGPGGDRRLPVLLTRTPYGKRLEALAEQAISFARQGYLVAIQDCRGRFGSQGVFSKYTAEPEDGYDAVEWLAGRPEGTGQVGMWGTSYMAHIQAAAAKLNPPHLRTIVLNMGGMANGWRHDIRNHGAFELRQVNWAFGQAARDARDPVIRAMFQAEKVADWVGALPLRPGLSPLAASPSIEQYLLTMMTESDYGPYWSNPGLQWEDYYDQTADIPMIHVSGWFDAYCGSAIENFTALSQRKRGPVYLLIGPWTHGRNASSHAGDVEFGAAAAMPEFAHEWHLAWFDKYLRGGTGAAPVGTPVKVFVMGTGDGHKDASGRLVHGGYWEESQTWPLPGTRFVELYLHHDGALSPRSPGREIAPTRYLFDPRDPVPTIGASTASSDPIFAGGAFDQRERPFTGNSRTGFYGSKPPYLPLRARPDVAVFQTGPLPEDVKVAGPIRVELHASSSAPDTDFTAKLIDVYPPSADFPQGFEMNLTDGIVRARYRGGRHEQELLEPGRVYSFTIEPFPTANVFKRGHRIRVDISSSNFPRFDVNPNTGEPLGRSRRYATAENALYHDAQRPSHVVLPLIDADVGRLFGGRESEDQR